MNSVTHKKPSFIKKYFWHCIIFFVIAITGGIVMADYEAKSTSNWVTYSSKSGAVTFKHPQSFKIIEDHGWRITVYPYQNHTANNIKILYSPKNPTDENSGESQFLANCQAGKVNELDANGTRIRIYEDSICGTQSVPQTIIVYSKNGMHYDIGIFGTIDKNKLYQFLSTFTFEAMR